MSNRKRLWKSSYKPSLLWKNEGKAWQSDKGRAWRRKEDADYFNSYKNILQELLDEEKERKKLGLSNTFEFAVFGELMNITKDEVTSKNFTKKISEGIREETELVGWKTKTSSEKRLGNIIYDIMFEIQNKKKIVKIKRMNWPSGLLNWQKETYEYTF